MLTEVALTPQIFDPESNLDREAWLGALNGLARDFFPRNAAWPVLVANLRDGTWISEVKKTIGAISDQKTRWQVQALTTRMRDVLVNRPGGDGWFDSEAAWAKEAIASHQTEPLGRIVLTDGLHSTCRTEQPSCWPLGKVQENSFWSGIQNPAQVPMDIATQVALLRPICLHAEYIAMKLHHAWGTGNDDTSFAAAVFASAFRRADGFSRVEAELHVAGDVTTPAGRTKVVQNTKGVLAAKLPPGARVVLCMWPKSLERKLIAGRLTASAGAVLRAPKWGISFNHVARPQDNSAEITTWTLVPGHDLNTFSRDVDADSPSVLYREVLAF